VKASLTELENHFVDEARLIPCPAFRSDHVGVTNRVEVEIIFRARCDARDDPTSEARYYDLIFPMRARASCGDTAVAFATISLPKVDIRDDHISFYQHFPDDSPPASDRLKAQIDKERGHFSRPSRRRGKVTEYNAKYPR